MIKRSSSTATMTDRGMTGTAITRIGGRSAWDTVLGPITMPVIMAGRMQECTTVRGGMITIIRVGVTIRGIITGITATVMVITAGGLTMITTSVALTRAVERP